MLVERYFYDRFFYGILCYKRCLTVQKLTFRDISKKMVNYNIISYMICIILENSLNISSRSCTSFSSSRRSWLRRLPFIEFGDVLSNRAPTYIRRGLSFSPFSWCSMTYRAVMTKIETENTSSFMGSGHFSLTPVRDSATSLEIDIQSLDDQSLKTLQCQQNQI